eukprot:Hpha_TRINITY_DN15243_c2_g1::TRINITY_DN15243_c2_g1_i1::g.65948::m.65948/K16051/tesI; 3-oxo-5alpha-steroid 4-dehydrogenase
MPTFIGNFLYANTGIMGLGAGLTAGPIVVGVLVAFFTLLIKEATRVYTAGAFAAYVVYLFGYAKWRSVGSRRRAPSVGGGAQYDDVFDLVVVGFGGAGAAAALEAANRGLKVLVIERFGGGGATARSGGVYYAGGGTALQSKLGVKDDPENMFRYLKEEMGGTVPDAELRVFAEASRGDVNFLLEHGVSVGQVEGAKIFDFHKTSHPPNGYALYFSGSEQAAPFCEQAYPAQRGHLAVGTKEMPGSTVGTGAVLFGGMQRAALKHSNITLRIQTAGTRLVMDHGKVAGIETRNLDSCPWGLQLLAELAEALGSCMKPPQLKPCDAFAQWTIRNIEATYGHPRIVKARKGVVIAAGGFGANLSMVRQHCPQYTGCMPLGTLGDDGSGIGLGMAVGAKLTGMDRGSAWKFTYPPEAFLKTVQVGMDGTRLGNEDVYGARLTANMTKAGGEAWLVMDQKLWDEAKAEVTTSKTMVIFQKGFGWMNLYMNRKKGATLAELAQQCKLPASSLKRTIEEYNEGCRAGEDKQFKKNKKFLSAIENGPYYAIHFAAANTLWMTPFLTLGGLKVDFSTGLVLNDQGDKIQGLYAAGRSASGIPAVSYVSGLSIADCVFSGRRAARHAAGQASGLPEEAMHLYK